MLLLMLQKHLGIMSVFTCYKNASPHMLNNIMLPISIFPYYIVNYNCYEEPLFPTIFDFILSNKISLFTDVLFSV